MDAYDRCTNLKKNIADIVAIYGRGRELFRPPTYIRPCTKLNASPKHLAYFVGVRCGYNPVQPYILTTFPLFQVPILYLTLPPKITSLVSCIRATFPVSHSLLYLFCHGWTALVGLGLLIVEVSRSHSDTPHLVGLLWTSDQLVAQTST